MLPLHSCTSVKKSVEISVYFLNIRSIFSNKYLWFYLPPQQTINRIIVFKEETHHDQGRWGSNDAKLLFMYVLAVCITSGRKCIFKSFPCFLIGLSFCCSVLNVFYIFCTLDPYQIYNSVEWIIGLAFVPSSWDVTSNPLELPNDSSVFAVHGGPLRPHLTVCAKGVTRSGFLKLRQVEALW